MQMNKKYQSVILLTAIFVLSVIICIVIMNISSIDSKPAVSEKINTSSTTLFTDMTDILEDGGTTAIIPAVTTNKASGGNNDILDSIMDDIYDKDTPVINNPSYGANVNSGGPDYIVDGQAVTTIYDTEESTKNGETTAPEPEETTHTTNTTAKTHPVDNSEGTMVDGE